MNNVSLKASTFNYVPKLGVIAGLSLNAKEVKCLEMALYFLSEQLNKSIPDLRFVNFPEYRLRYINDWMNSSRLKSQLRSDGSNSAVWGVMDMEDIKWLALALEVGITEEVIISMAADDANYERDMALMYEEDIDLNGQYYAFHNYYCSIAQLQPRLLQKLKYILNNYFAI